MSIVPLEQWLAHRPRRGMIAVDTVVLHASEVEDVDELIHKLRHEDHSFHYIIDRDGTIAKCVPFSAVSFHCANSYGPHEAARGMSSERDATGAFVEHSCINDYTIGVCFINRNDGEDPFTPDQLGACITLLKDLKTPLPKLRHLTTHAYVAPGRATDPAGLDVSVLAKAAQLEIWRSETTPA